MALRLVFQLLSKAIKSLCSSELINRSGTQQDCLASKDPTVWLSYQSHAEGMQQARDVSPFSHRQQSTSRLINQSINQSVSQDLASYILFGLFFKSCVQLSSQVWEKSFQSRSCEILGGFRLQLTRPKQRTTCVLQVIDQSERPEGMRECPEKQPFLVSWRHN